MKQTIIQKYNFEKFWKSPYLAQNIFYSKKICLLLYVLNKICTKDLWNAVLKIEFNYHALWLGHRQRYKFRRNEVLNRLLMPSILASVDTFLEECFQERASDILLVEIIVFYSIRYVLFIGFTCIYPFPSSRVTHSWVWSITFWKYFPH